MLLSGLLGKSRGVVSDSCHSLWAMDPNSLSVLNDGDRRRVLELLSVKLDDVVDESSVLLVGSVNLSVVEVWVSVENLLFQSLSVFVVLGLEIWASSAWVVEHDNVDSVGSSVLVESSFKDVEQGFTVVVGKSVDCHD